MSTFSSAPIVIDGKGHLLGRLASIIAKQVSFGHTSWQSWMSRSCKFGLLRSENGSKIARMSLVKGRPYLDGSYGMDMVMGSRWDHAKMCCPRAPAEIRKSNVELAGVKRRNNMSINTWLERRAHCESVLTYNTDPHWPKGHRCSMRGDQLLRFILQEQAEVPRLLAQ